MISRFIFVHVDKCKFFLKNSSSKCWLCFLLFVWLTQKYFRLEFGSLGYNSITMLCEKFVEVSISGFNKCSSKIRCPALFFCLYSFLILLRCEIQGVEIWNLLLFPVFKLGWESTQLEDICDIVVCDKAKNRGGTVNKISVYAEVIVRWASTEKLFWEISQGSHEINYCGVSFW